MRRSSLKLSICFLVCFALFAAGCSGAGLSEDFDENEVEKVGEDVISYINNNDSDSILEISTVEVKKALTEEVLQEIYESIGEGGDFEEVLDISMVGTEDDVSKEEFAIVVVKTKYEIKEIIYTITFTKQMKLAGLFYK